MIERIRSDITYAVTSPMTAFNTMAILKWVIALAVSVWTGLSTTVHLLCVLMALDLFTGMTDAFVLHKLSAQVSFRGLTKKAMILVLVYVGHMITRPLNVGFDLGEMIALAYCLNEVLSIIENCADIGVPIPPVLIQTLAKFRKVMPVPLPGDITTTIIETETVVIPPASEIMKSHEEHRE